MPETIEAGARGHGLKGPAPTKWFCAARSPGSKRKEGLCAVRSAPSSLFRAPSLPVPAESSRSTPCEAEQCQVGEQEQRALIARSHNITVLQVAGHSDSRKSIADSAHHECCFKVEGEDNSVCASAVGAGPAAGSLAVVTVAGSSRQCCTILSSCRDGRSHSPRRKMSVRLS